MFADLAKVVEGDVRTANNVLEDRLFLFNSDSRGFEVREVDASETKPRIRAGFWLRNGRIRVKWRDVHYVDYEFSVRQEWNEEEGRVDGVIFYEDGTEDRFDSAELWRISMAALKGVFFEDYGN